MDKKYAKPWIEVWFGWAGKGRELNQAHCHVCDFRVAFLATCRLQNALGYRGKFAVCADFCSRILCVLPWRMITREALRFAHYMYRFGSKTWLQFRRLSYFLPLIFGQTYPLSMHKRCCSLYHSGHTNTLAIWQTHSCTELCSGCSDQP